jgi:hypothetical protein
MSDVTGTKDEMSEIIINAKKLYKCCFDTN